MLYDATAVNIDQVNSRQEPESTASEHIGLEIKKTTLFVMRLISWNFRVAVLAMGPLTANFYSFTASKWPGWRVGR